MERAEIISQQIINDNIVAEEALKNISRWYWNENKNMVIIAFQFMQYKIKESNNESMLLVAKDFIEEEQILFSQDNISVTQWTGVDGDIPVEIDTDIVIDDTKWRKFGTLHYNLWYRKINNVYVMVIN